MKSILVVMTTGGRRWDSHFRLSVFLFQSRSVLFCIAHHLVNLEKCKTAWVDRQESLETGTMADTGYQGGTWEWPAYAVNVFRLYPTDTRRFTKFTSVLTYVCIVIFIGAFVLEYVQPPQIRCCCSLFSSVFFLE
jgi:hypothetical protein